MTKRGGYSAMLIPTLILGVLALVLVLLGYFKGEGQHISGMKSALTMTIEILPLLIFGKKWGSNFHS